MPQNPVESLLFVSQLRAGPGITLTPNGTGIVTVSSSSESAQDSIVAITTVGDGTLTAVGILAGNIVRSGATVAFTDTTATAADIVALIPNATAGQSFRLNISNNTAFLETLAAGVGVTLNGLTLIPGRSTAQFLVTLDSLTAVTIYGMGVASNASLPPSKFTTAALSAGTIPAASITGADLCVWQNTGATPGAQTFPTAATLYAAIPNAFIGMTSIFRVVNTGAGTLTLTADAGPTITITGTATIAQNVWREYQLTFTSATAATVQSIGSGVSP